MKIPTGFTPYLRDDDQQKIMLDTECLGRNYKLLN